MNKLTTCDFRSIWRNDGRFYGLVSGLNQHGSPMMLVECRHSFQEISENRIACSATFWLIELDDAPLTVPYAVLITECALSCWLHNERFDHPYGPSIMEIDGPQYYSAINSCWQNAPATDLGEIS